MGHVIDFSPDYTAKKKIEKAKQEFIANGGEVQLTKEQEIEQQRKLHEQAERESAETAAAIPIRGNVIRERISAKQVSRLQQRSGKATSIVFVGKLMYYCKRLWMFQGSFNPPSWFPLMTADEIMASGDKFTEDDKQRYANAVARCCETGARRFEQKRQQN